MRRLRRLLLRDVRLPLLIAAAALLLRLFVPAGFMPELRDGRIALTLCSGIAAPAAMPSMEHGRHAAPREQGPAGTGSPCAFADLALPLIGGVDPLLLAAALLFAATAALLDPERLALRTFPRLRPPPQGPPSAPSAA